MSVEYPKGELTGMLEEGTEFEGKLCFRGVFQINGKFKGEIFTSDTIIFGPNSVIDANVEASVAIIKGEFKGKLKTSHRVEVHAPAVFRGDIQTPSLSVTDGVIFEGSSKMLTQSTSNDS